MRDLESISQWVEKGQDYESFAWNCPVCGRDATIGQYDRTDRHNPAPYEAKDREVLGAVSLFVRCPNPSCRRVSLYAFLYTGKMTGTVGSFKLEERLNAWRLIPASGAKVFPEYVPKQIRTDYEEAHLILGLSPKAASTLARRCLQGMIRDFHGIKKTSLKKEIEALEGLVDPLTWRAIDTVRSLGNIGAHMEKDVDLIVEVDPDEASMLTGLVETLIEEWYVARHDRERKMNALVKLGSDKEQERKRMKEEPEPRKEEKPPSR